MATDDGKVRITCGPQAKKLAMSDGGKGTAEILDESILTLQKERTEAISRASAAEQRATFAESETALLREQNDVLSVGLAGLGKLLDSANDRNRISAEVARVFDLRLEAIEKLQLHICGLIGLNVVEGEDRDGLLQNMKRTVAEVSGALKQRAGTANERSRDNIEATKRLAREINDTRAAVQSTNNQELELVMPEQDGLER